MALPFRSPTITEALALAAATLERLRRSAAVSVRSVAHSRQRVAESRKTLERVQRETLDLARDSSES